MNPYNYLYLAALLFTIGAVGVVVRRNAIVVFMCIELMLNATNLALVAFARMHPKLESRGGWADHIGALPIIEGTVVGLRVERLPGDRDPRPVWLWTSKPVPDNGAEVDHWWSMFIRRFDLEHTFRFLKQTLGWARARLREQSVADRWT